MKTQTIIRIAGASSLALAMLPSSPDAATFDPLLDGAAVCSAARPGRPPLLDRLVLAQAETKPFQPPQQTPAAAAEGTPPLYPDLGKLHMPVSANNAKAQACFDQGRRLTFGFNHAEAARAAGGGARLAGAHAQQRLGAQRLDRDPPPAWRPAGARRGAQALRHQLAGRAGRPGAVAALSPVVPAKAERHWRYRQHSHS